MKLYPDLTLVNKTVTDEDALIAEAEASTVIGVEISLGPYFSLPSNEVFAT